MQQGWHDGKFTATVVGAEGLGVRIVTKYAVTSVAAADEGSGVNVLEVGVVADGE